MEITKNAFDDLQYFVEMAEKNKLVKENGFYCGFCSGPEGLDQVMAEYRDHANFFLVDDTTSGNTFGAKPGWFDRKGYAIYIIVGYEPCDPRQGFNEIRSGTHVPESGVGVHT